ncbi:MAG: hypothetical protein SX243_24365 [Acidobacteriota bacterium]|nr:hypothetical protein [Acidobacteriota bacterium]
MTIADRKLKKAKRSAERALDEGRNAAELALEAGQAKVTDAVQARYGEARKTFGELTGDVGTYVRDHPTVTISISWALGLLVGLLLGSQCTRALSDS